VLVARELMPLWLTGESSMGFPHAREYRVIVVDREAIGHQFYWGPEDPLGALSKSEREEMLAVALAAAGRLSCRIRRGCFAR
jgi:hypothetical protein